MSYAEYTPLQWFLPFLRSSFRLPQSDLPLDRYVERPMPRELRPGDWSDHPAANDVVRLPRAFQTGDTEADGRPAQVGHATRRTTWEVNGTYGPAFTASVPVPAAGSYWIEDAPRPWWQKAFGNFSDKHVIVTDPMRGGWFEIIGATQWGGQWRCSGLGQFDRHGELVKGRYAIAAKRALLPMLWNRFDMPHLCTITVRGSDRDPRDAQHLGKWLILDAAKVEMPATEEGRRLYDALTTFGCIYGDHGGTTNLSNVSGGQWAGVDWGGLEFRLSDFLIAS